MLFESAAILFHPVWQLKEDTFEWNICYLNNYLGIFFMRWMNSKIRKIPSITLNIEQEFIQKMQCFRFHSDEPSEPCGLLLPTELGVESFRLERTPKKLKIFWKLIQNLH